MGLFNGYLKEGPGVDKNAKKKKGFFLFLDILFRKFFNLIKANCLYILFSIPFIAVIFMFIVPYTMDMLGFSEQLKSETKTVVYSSVGIAEGNFGKSQNTDEISKKFGFEADNSDVVFFSLEEPKESESYITITVNTENDGEYTGYILCNTDKEERYEVILDKKSVGNTAYCVSEAIKYSDGEDAMYILPIELGNVSAGRHKIQIQAPSGETAPAFSSFILDDKAVEEKEYVKYTVGEKNVDISNFVPEDKKETASNVENMTKRVELTWYLIISALFTMIIFTFFGSGPLSAAYAYATRCFTRGEHTWLLSDGKDQVKENFKNSILMFIVNMLMLLILFLAFRFYTDKLRDGGPIATLALFARPFVVVIVFIMAIMNMFAYQIMVTYECKFKDLVKNSVMIALAKLPMCVLLMAISLFVCYICCGILADPVIAAVIYMIIGIMFARFPIEFYAVRVLEKNMRTLKKREKKNAAKITYLDEEE